MPLIGLAQRPTRSPWLLRLLQALPVSLPLLIPELNVAPCAGAVRLQRHQGEAGLLPRRGWSPVGKVLPVPLTDDEVGNRYCAHLAASPRVDVLPPKRPAPRRLLSIRKRRRDVDTGASERLPRVSHARSSDRAAGNRASSALATQLRIPARRDSPYVQRPAYHLFLG